MDQVLRVIDGVDNFPYYLPSSYYTLVAHDGTAIGYLTEPIAVRLQKENGFSIEGRSVNMDSDVDDFDKRTKLMERIGLGWKTDPEFAESLGRGWRNEKYTVYNPSHTPYMLIERAFAVLLGVVTYGVHVTGYIQHHNHVRLWIPRRSFTKPTYPGMLDNTVAGGIGYPYDVSETLVKECYEEAGISPAVARTAKPVGVLLYMFMPEGEPQDQRRVQPEVEYIYDLKLDATVPHPVDGEAQDFKLMTVDEVVARLGEFKPNSGLVVVDFLIRHGLIDPEHDAYLDIGARSHRRLPFPTR